MLNAHAIALAPTLRRSNELNECSCSAGHDVTSGRLENTAPIAMSRLVPSSVKPEITRMMRMMIAARKSRLVGGPFMIEVLRVHGLSRRKPRALQLSDNFVGSCVESISGMTHRISNRSAFVHGTAVWAA